MEKKFRLFFTTIVSFQIERICPLISKKNGVIINIHRLFRQTVTAASRSLQFLHSLCRVYTSPAKRHFSNIFLHLQERKTMSTAQHNSTSFDQVTFRLWLGYITIALGYCYVSFRLRLNQNSVTVGLQIGYVQVTLQLRVTYVTATLKLCYIYVTIKLRFSCN